MYYSAKKVFWPALLGVTGAGLVLAGCGTTSPPPQATVKPLTQKTLKHLFPPDATLVKTTSVHFAGEAPQEMVVTATSLGKNQVVGHLQVSAVAWNPDHHRWQVSWQSATLDLQQQFQPGLPKVPAISAWRVNRTVHGVLLGILDPASLGASTVWNDGLLLWLSPNQAPKTLWVGKGKTMVADGALSPIAHGIQMNQDACSAIEATQHGGHATLTPLSCTDLSARVAGRRLAFTAGGNGQTIHPSTTTMNVSVGHTVVFWPSNQETAALVNRGSLGLYGGAVGSALPAGQVPLAAVDTLSRWYYKFTEPGTYRFAIVPNATSAVSVQPTVTIQVTG